MNLWWFFAEINFYSFVAISLQKKFCCFFFLIALRQILLICRRYAVFWFQRSSLQNAKHKGADSLVCQDCFTFNFTISKVNLEQLIVCSRKYSHCGWNCHWLFGFLMFSGVIPWEQVWHLYSEHGLFCHQLHLLLCPFSPAPYSPFQHK